MGTLLSSHLPLSQTRHTGMFSVIIQFRVVSLKYSSQYNYSISICVIILLFLLIGLLSKDLERRLILLLLYFFISMPSSVSQVTTVTSLSQTGSSIVTQALGSPAIVTAKEPLPSPSGITVAQASLWNCSFVCFLSSEVSVWYGRSFFHTRIYSLLLFNCLV